MKPSTETLIEQISMASIVAPAGYCCRSTTGINHAPPSGGRAGWTPAAEQGCDHVL
jgi:hypothetical protein